MPAAPQPGQTDARYPYLQADAFISDFLGAQTLRLAFESGLVDCLSVRDSMALLDLCERLRAEPRDLQVLLDLLVAYGVVVREADACSLSAQFRRVWPFRDLIEAKLEIANRLAPDLIKHFRSFIFDMNAYMSESGLFELFDYGRCYEPTAENIAGTRTWMRYTSALSRYEAQPFLDHLDLSGVHSVLDIGGNSGEFAMRLCAAQPDLKAAVFDLPVVCAIGREHAGSSPEGGRTSFIEGDLRRGDLPDGHDLHVFKSFLHDWPEGQVMDHLRKSHSALATGGTVAIFERSAAPTATAVAYANIPLYLFRRFYRDPSLYAGLLEVAGFTDIRVKKVQLDSPFMLVSAGKV